MPELSLDEFAKRLPKYDEVIVPEHVGRQLENQIKLGPVTPAGMEIFKSWLDGMVIRVDKHLPADKALLVSQGKIIAIFDFAKQEADDANPTEG